MAQAVFQAPNGTLLMVKGVSVEAEVLQNQPLLLLFSPGKRANLNMMTLGGHGLTSGCAEGRHADVELWREGEVSRDGLISMSS